MDIGDFLAALLFAMACLLLFMYWTLQLLSARAWHLEAQRLPRPLRWLEGRASSDHTNTFGLVAFGCCIAALEVLQLALLWPGSAISWTSRSASVVFFVAQAVWLAVLKGSIRVPK